MNLYSDNPIQDFLNYDEKQCAELDKLPKCSECGEAIQGEYCFEINDELICEACLNEYYRKQTDDYIE